MSLQHKIDFAVILTVDHANPNGDPLNGNRPRTDYDGYGEISDVCLKRKIRDRLMEQGQGVYVQSDDRKLDGMMVIRGIYERHGVTSLNHGVGFNTAAIELLLPTYGERLGLKGKICRNWTLNPQPTLIPAIENGWVESVHSFGNEDGMQDYIKARPDIFFTGPDGSLRSNREFCQLAGHYAVDLFAGSTLQIDPEGNTSTVTKGRITGFGGAPNLGSDARGRRHSSPAWLSMITTDAPTAHGRKLVVQLAETFKAGGVPTFVENLDAIDVGKNANLPCTPIMPNR